MRYRTPGNSGLRVSEPILGAMTFGEHGGVGAPIEECRKIVDGYLEAGGNAIDTAINYRDGQSEEILGELLAGRRESIGARSLPQLTDNLGAIDVTLTAEQVDRLTAATDFSRGFPHDFIDGIAPWVFGKALIPE